MVRLPRRSIFACLLPLAAALPVHADEADVIRFQASMGMKWDDNLFRQPESSKPQAETIITTIAGVDFNKQVSLQRFIAHVSWVDTHYSNNSTSTPAPPNTTASGFGPRVPI